MDGVYQRIHDEIKHVEASLETEHASYASGWPGTSPHGVRENGWSLAQAEKYAAVLEAVRTARILGEALFK